MERTIEERLADEFDISLDQIARWTLIPYARVRAWAYLETDLTEDEQARLLCVLALAAAYYERCTAMAADFEWSTRTGTPVIPLAVDEDLAKIVRPRQHDNGAH